MRSAAKTAGPSTLKIGTKQINVTNLSKVLYPAAGFTKQDVIDYYVGVGDVILKHLKGRTVTLKRYPNGSEAPFFYEKNCPIHRPAWINTKNVASQRTGGTNYCLIENKAALAWIGQIASLELHTSLAKTPNIAKPTMAVFDLDPGPPADMLDCIRVALHMRDVLKGLGLESFPKTSGGKGLHFYVPLNTPCTFDDTKAFARTVAELFEREDPEHVLSSMKKVPAHGKDLHRLEPERRAQDDGVRLLAPRSPAADGIDAGHMEGTGSGSQCRRPVEARL